MDKSTITMIHAESRDSIEVPPGSVANARASGWIEVKPTDTSITPEEPPAEDAAEVRDSHEREREEKRKRRVRRKGS